MLQIIRNEHYLTDKNANRFIMALQKEGFKQEVDIKIITIHKQEEICEIDFTLPTIIIEPFSYVKPKSYNDADKDTTAKVVFSILKDNIKEGDTITLIGRGKTVGIPLSNMIRDNLNVNLIQTNSYTNYYDLSEFISISDVVICCTNNEILYGYYMNNNLLIDIGNTFNYRNGEPDIVYKMKDIGKLTVQQIIKNAKEIM